MCAPSDNTASQMRADEQKRQQMIRGGINAVNTTFAGFDPAFYDNRAQAYRAYAMPQLGQQYRQQSMLLAGNLGNRGLSRSSSAQRMFGSLGQEMAMQERNITDEGIRQAQGLRKDVEQQRANVIAQLEASADPTLAKQQALAASSQFQAPSVFTPVADTFAQWANIYLANRGMQSLQPAIQQYKQASYGAPAAPTIKTY